MKHKSFSFSWIGAPTDVALFEPFVVFLPEVFFSVEMPFSFLSQ